MTLASGAHVKIGSYEFILDETIDAGTATGNLYRPHYKHTYESLFANAAQFIPGMVKKESVHPERLIWSWDDWSGGENNRIYYADDPTVYDFSYGLNPRIRGQLTGRPNRTYVPSSLTTNNVGKRPNLTVGTSTVWYGGGYRIGYITTDSSTWQVVNSTGTDATDFSQLQSKSANYYVTAMTGDGNYMYYSGWHSAASGTRIVLAKSQDNTAKAGTVQAEQTGRNAYAGMTIMNGRMYAWTGTRLYEYDISNLSGTTPTALSSDQIRPVSPSYGDPTSANVYNAQWWANCVASENSVFCFYSTAGQSTVYQFSNKGGFGPLWTGPYGFTIKAMKYQNGVIFFSGHWGGESVMAGRGAMYAMSLRTLEPVFICWFRKQQNKNLQMQEMANSYGSQIMVAAGVTGRMFIYDAELDGMSMLDSIGTTGTETDSLTATDAFTFLTNPPGDRIGDMMTFGGQRMAVVYDTNSSAAGSYRILSYDDDEPANRQGSTATADYSAPLESGDWDFDLPFEQKALMGFDVSYRPITTGQSFTVAYSLDQAAYVTAGTITSAHADAAKGRTFIAVSNGTTTTKFTSLRVKLTLIATRTAAVDYKPPIILSLSTEAQLITYDQLWELIIRLKDDQTRQKTGKRQQKGSTARDWLLSTIANKSAVTFLDGYRYENPGNFTTHTCTIEDPEDIIIRKGEGSMRIRLRTIPT